MSLYDVALFKEGQLLLGRNMHGTCTGVFQGAGYGSFGQAPEFDTVTVELSCTTKLSDQFMIAISKTKLMQALCPGLEYISSRPYDDKKLIKWKFPGLDHLPSDQVICAMRIINSWGCGFYSESVKTLREYELNTSEMLVIAMFGTVHPKSSDSVPSLWYQTKAYAMTREFQLVDRTRKVQTYSGSKIPAYASMLLPLIRGEIQPGWQPLLQRGYMKEEAIIYSQAGDPYRAMPWWDLCPENAMPTVNHPLIHPSAEGPELNLNSNLIEVVEWVLTQLGK